MSHTTVDVAYAVSLCHSLCVLVPLCSYWIYQLCTYRTEMFLIKRNIKMTIGFIASFLSFIISMDILLIFYWIDSTPLAYTASTIAFLSTAFCACCLLCKTWLIYYDYKWTYYTLKVQWTSIINTSTHSNNWYIKHRKNYGNPHWIGKLFAVIFIVIVSLMFLSFSMIFLGETFLLRIIGLIVLMSGAFSIQTPYVIILCKTPHSQKGDDRFYIHAESKLIAKLLPLWSLVLFAMFGAYGVIPHASVWITIVSVPVITTFSALMIYISTKLIITKNVIKHSDEKLLMIDVASDSAADTVATQSTSRENLLAILSHKEAVHLFMLHLSHEYSMELLLGFIEFTQYLDYLGKIIEKENDVKQAAFREKRDLDSISLIDSAPMSSIVANEDKEHGFERKAYELYNKYIAVGSEYAINISGKLRNQIKNEMDHYEGFKNINVKKIELDALFVECRKELFKYLTFSHWRFEKREEYKQILPIIQFHGS